MKKKILFIAFIFLFIFSYTNVFAASHGEGSKCLKFEFNDDGFPASVVINHYVWNSEDDEFHTNDGNYTIVILAGKKGNEFPELSTPGGFDTPENVTVDSRPNKDQDPLVDGDEYIYTITLTNYNTSDTCQFLGGISLREGAEPTVPFHEVSGDITISISGEELEYHYVEDKPNEADVTYFKFDINGGTEDERLVPFTFGNAKYTYIEGKEPPRNVSKAETKQAINYKYPYDDSGYVEFCVNGGGTDEYTKIVINGIDYANQAPHTQQEVFEHFAGGGSSMFCIKNVPYNASGYSVVVEGRSVTDDKKVAGFDWSYLSHDRSPDVSEENEGDFAHGKVEFVNAKFVDEDNQVYEFNTYSKFNAGRYHETGEVFQWANGDKNYPESDRRMAWGNVLAPYGTELTIRIVPDEGYQLVSMATSEHGFQTTDEPGVYKINLTKENLKFNDGYFKLEPKFAKIGSEVQADSEAVKGGTIETNEKVSNGSLKLSITDVNVSDERKNAFENKAKESGYEVNNIVDISLYNSIYKGGKKDSKGNYLSWDTEVNNLTNKATIALELDDELTGKDVALVHETHDGDKVTGYELVDVNYNDSKNTLEFEESSFSNFAIVVKEEEINTPDEKEMVKVDFDTRCPDCMMEPVEIEKGSKVSKPKDPSQTDLIFVGWYLDEDCKEEFDFNTPIEKDLILYAKWNDKVQVYTVTDNGNSVTFNEIKDREYELIFVDVLPMTDSELKELGATREQYNAIKKLALEASNKYGTLLSFYKIEVNDKEDGTGITDGPFEIKIKITSEMKKYNVFKMIYLDDDFKAGDVVELKVEGDYLVGTLPHLSAYTLVGSVDNTLPDVPKTGDNIYNWIIVFIVSIICITLSTKYITKASKVRVK